MKLTLPILTISCLAILLNGTAAARAETFASNATGSFFSSSTLAAVADVETIPGLLACAAYDPSHPCSSSGNSFFYDNLLYSGGVSADKNVSITNAQQDNGHSSSFSIIPLPEPGSFLLLGIGLLGLAGVVRSRVRASVARPDDAIPEQTVLDHPAGIP